MNEEQKNKVIIYRLNDEEKLEYMLNNTNYLADIDINNIKQIEADEENNVYVLLKDGKLYRNGEQQDTEIKMFDMLWGGAVLFKITKDNRIVPVDNCYRSDFEFYFNNNNCKYKKIITDVFFSCGFNRRWNCKSSEYISYYRNSTRKFFKCR